MKDSSKTYSVYDLIEDKEILSHVSAKEVSETIGIKVRDVYNYAHSGMNYRRRYRITRNEDAPIDTRPEWEIEFEFQWEQICNLLNPHRFQKKGGENNGNEQKEDSRVHKRKK